MYVKIATLSDIGGRDNNDDTVMVRQRDENSWVFVGDGLGGYVNKNLLIGVNCNEFCAENALSDHSVNSVSTAAANADYLYLYRAFKIVINFKCHFINPLRFLFYPDFQN